MKQRQYHLDILRIVATVFVVLLHVSAQQWSAAATDSVAWHVYNIGDSITRWSVPAFAMISGALFLDPERTISIKSLYTKNVVRLAVAFVVWSLVYAIYKTSAEEFKFRVFAERVIKGNGHMWFLLMIIGLYLLVPLLRQLCKDEKCMKYFLLLSFLFNIVAPTVFSNIMPILPESDMKTLLMFVKPDYTMMQMDFVMGYSFYFVLGYYLNSRKQSTAFRIVAYIAAILGVLITIIATHKASVMLGWKYNAFYSNFSLNVFVQAVGYFVLFKAIPWRVGPRGGKVLGVLSKCSFGVYLMHELLIGMLYRYFGISVLTFPAYISVPLLVVGISLVSLVFSFILNKIPLLNKYIV